MTVVRISSVLLARGISLRVRANAGDVSVQLRTIDPPRSVVAIGTSLRAALRDAIHDWRARRV